MSCHGLLPTTSSCAPAMDLNIPQMVPLFVDLLLFHLLLHTVIPMLNLEKSFSRLGPKMISVLEERDGGTKAMQANDNVETMNSFAL